MPNVLQVLSLTISVPESQERGEEEESRRQPMEVQPHPTSVWTPISSPNLRSPVSAESSNSNSVGSSLDTASASAHLERYELPWSFSDGNGIYRGTGPRRSSSYTAFMEWNAITPGGRHHPKALRPLGGASRRRLVRQIQQLTKDKAELQAQLAAMVSSGSRSIWLPGFRSTEQTPGQTGDQSAVGLDGIDGVDGVDGLDEIVEHHLDHHSFHNMMIGGNVPDNPYPLIDGLVGYPSTLVGPEQTLEASSPSSLEHIAALGNRLRAAIEMSTTHLLNEDDVVLLDRPGMKDLLTSRPPNPERAQLYARFFAKRFIEIQKRPKDRCLALQPGPLQRSVKHPAYVNILMSGLREPFIAHMGAFDEKEFGLWILNGVEFHSEALSDTHVEIADLDDSCYEFSADFFKRFPFTGTKEMIATANRWRAERNETALKQTQDMVAAEEYTKSRQLRALLAEGET